jgi:hypothetical protein
MQPPESWYEPLILPALATFFGLVTFFIGIAKENSTGKVGFAKWIGVIIAVVGLIAGWPAFSAYTNSGIDGRIYRDIASGGRMAMGHYAAIGLPLIAILVSVIFNVFHVKKLRAEMAEE